MFSNLSDKLTKTLKNLTGQGRLTQKNIQEALEEVRLSLLEADVALTVIDKFLSDVEKKAIGQDVLTSLKPAQALVKVVNDELVNLMGGETSELNLHTTPPAIILLAGLQGSGKTTTAAKLANRLQKQDKKKVMLVSLDVYRPAAILQLQNLSEQINAQFFPANETQKPEAICQAALAAAKTQFMDVVIFDSAGRLHIDDAMMKEINAIHDIITPIETLFVVDSMTGQDAANTAKAFNDHLPLTGIVLTKTDGDARGGAALSARYLTGKPIKFLGTGEKIDGLEIFHPDRIASRILGMGDVLSLVEAAQQKIDHKEAEKIAKDFEDKKRFDLEMFRNVIMQMRNMGGITSMLSKMPGMGKLPLAIQQGAGDDAMNKVMVIIDSMTKKERRFPKIIQASRISRIAKGSGTSSGDVKKLLKQFDQMAKMMKGGMGKMMKRMQSMQKMLPPGMMPPGMD